jgi:hypothetical protein
MQFSDVTSEYLKCHFCGMQVRKDIAFRSDGHLYHSKECYDFSLGYKDLVKKLEAVTKDHLVQGYDRS